MSSIYGYDIVLSLKETTIQNQFQILYETPAGRQTLPSLDDAGNPVSSTPKQQYLLNHDLYATTAKGDNRETVLDAHIQCPTIQLGAGSGQQAGLRFTFCKDESSVQSSVLKHWVGNEHKSTVVDGWTISWICDITTNTIENVVKQLIEPSKKEAEPVLLDSAIRKRFEDIASSPNKYLITSLFCALESQQLASSFEVIDASGKAVDSASYIALKAIMIKRVNDIAATTTPGIPTADNPFILGYGIVQNTTGTGDQKNSTPGAFMPRNFSLLISPATTSQPACLNYLMQTQHSPQSGATTTADPDGLVKYLQGSLVINDAFSGFMILSRQLACQHLMGEMLGQKFFDSLDLSAIMQLDLLKKGTIDADSSKSSPHSGMSDSLSKVWLAADHFVHNIKRHEKCGFLNWETAYRSQNLSGDCTVTATLSNEAQPGKADGLRRLLMTFDISLMYMCETEYIATVQEHDHGNVSLKYRVTFVINTGEDGRWLFKIDKSRSVLPEVTDGKVHVKNEKADDRLGAFAWGSYSSQTPGGGVDSIPGFFSSSEAMALPNLQALTNKHLTSLASTINNAMSTLNQLVLMPAGDVYTFNGLDSTAEGFVTSRIKYKSRTSGRQI